VKKGLSKKVAAIQKGEYPSKGKKKFNFWMVSWWNNRQNAERLFKGSRSNDCLLYPSDPT